MLRKVGNRYHKMGPIGCPETSVTNYQSTLVTSQKSGGNLKLRLSETNECMVPSRLTEQPAELCPVKRRNVTFKYHFGTVWPRASSINISFQRSNYLTDQETTTKVTVQWCNINTRSRFGCRINVTDTIASFPL